MIGDPPFPLRPDELTTEFLSRALNKRVSSFTSRPLGQDRGMMGTLVLLDLRYQQRSAEGPARVVAKFNSDRTESLTTAKRGRTHERELKFYEYFAERTPARVPTVYGSWYDPQSARFVLLQEFIEGDESVDQLTGISAAQARLVLTEMAKLHATWWESTELLEADWLMRADGPERRANLHTLSSVGWPALASTLGELAPAERAFGEAMPEHISYLLSELGKLPRTFLHSDLRVDNMLFDSHTGDVVLLDWQGCCIGPPALDLAYFISQALEPAVRRDVEQDLLDHYTAELNAAGRPIDRAAATAGYDVSLIYGLVIAAAIPIVADPNEPRVQDLCASMATRAFAALADHGML